MLNPLKIILSIISAIIIYSFCMRYIKNVLKKSRINESAHTFLKSLFKIVLIIVLILGIMSIAFNIDISQFITIFSVFGITVSFAIKDSIANLASGILILLSRPFENNDFISLEEVSGNVVETNLIHTRLETIDNKIIYIPNSEISKNIIINYSKQENRNLDIIFSISYSENIDRAKKIILDVLQNSKYYIDIKEPEVVVESLASSSVNVMLRCCCKNKDYLNLKFYLNENVKKEFDKNNISIPFNTMDINIKKS